MSGFAKLFGSIVTSSIWCEDDATLRVWIAMLATCDNRGVVEGSIPGFANLARVAVPQMEHAVTVLSSPDPHSRTPDHEGRRIEGVPGGWKLLNYLVYRDRGQGKEGSRAPYMRERRAGGNALHKDATRGTEAEERVQKKETDNGTPQPPVGGSPADAGRPRRKAVKASDDSPEAREGCEDHARLAHRSVDYSASKLALFARLIRERRTRAEWCRVLGALDARAVPAAAFARDGDGKRKGPGPGLSWALRPGTDGGFDRILLQLDEQAADPTAGTLAVVPAGTRPSAFPTLGERNKAAVHEFVARERGRG